MKEVEASSCTFYVEDPWWPGELRLVLLPGVKYTEPMQGFLVPETTKRFVTQGETPRYCKDAQRTLDEDPDGKSARHRLIKDFPFFGAFSQREGVISYARFKHEEAGKLDAVLFVNFRERRKFRGALCARLERLKQSVFDDLPSVKLAVKDEVPLPLSHLFRLLQSAEDHIDCSVQDNFKRILDLAFEVAQLDEQKGVGTIHVFDHRTRVLNLVASKGSVDASIYPGAFDQLSVDQGRGVVSWVALTQREILINNLPDSEFRKIYIATRKDVRSELTVPIIAGEALVGVLNLESTRKDAFTPHCLRAIWCIANQAAAAYRPSEVVQRLLRICSEAPDRIGTPFPLEKIAVLVRDFLQADYCDIWSYDEDGKCFEAVGATDPRLKPETPPRPDGWTNFVRIKKTSVLIGQIKNTDDYHPHSWDNDAGVWRPIADRTDTPRSVNGFVIDLKVTVELGLPIITRDQCVGVAWLKYCDGYKTPQSADKMASLFAFGGQIALALMYLHRQEKKTQERTVEGILLLLRGLRHEAIGKIFELLLEEIRESRDPETFFNHREKWKLLIEFLSGYIDHLRWVSESRDLNGENVDEGLKLTIETVNLRCLVKEVISLANIIQETPACDDEGVDGITFLGDVQLLRLLVFNLLQNAKKYTPWERSAKPVIISTSKSVIKKTPWITLVVNDAGSGFPAELRGRIFRESGVHKSPPGRPVSGSGFGLFLCNKIVVAHGGKMLEPKQNMQGGTTMGFSLPLKEEVI
jgi:GAF domain-containing protein